MAKLVVFTVALTDRGTVVPAARVLRGLGRRGLRRARGQAGPDRGEAPRARAARQGDSGRDSREARSQEGVTSGLAATDLGTLLHHVCARHPASQTSAPEWDVFSGRSFSGNRIPEFRLRTGRAYLIACLAEATAQYLAPERDAFAGTVRVRWCNVPFAWPACRITL